MTPSKPVAAQEATEDDHMKTKRRRIVIEEIREGDWRIVVAVLILAVVAIVVVFSGCCEQPSKHSTFRLTYYPEPKAFYVWWEKCWAVADRRGINVDGDKDYFWRYWRGGLNPETAVTRYATETAQPELSR